MNLDKDLQELDIDYSGQTEFRNYTIKVEQDDLNDSPRDWDNLGTMVCWHGRHCLGDEHEFADRDMFYWELSGLYPDEYPEFLTDEQLSRCYKVAAEKNIILPLYVYEHGGITMSTAPYSCPWDSGQAGFIYVSLEQVRKEFSVKRVSKQTRKKIETYLTGEVQTYDYYLTGNVYWYSVEREDTDGEIVDVDSCGGFFGYHTDDDNYMVDNIKGVIQYDIEHTPSQGELF